MIFRRSRWEEELKEELQFHLETRADALVRAGLSHEEAMRRARVEFGRLDRSKEGCREARGGRWIDELSRNLVVAGRSIRKNPGFSAVAVLSLALGIGGNLAVFSIVQRLLLTELPVRQADQLYELVVVSSRGVNRGISYQKFERVRDHFTFFRPVFGWGGSGRHPLTDGTLTERVQVHAVTANYFEGLGLSAALGRLFTPEDDESDQVAVIAHDVWRTLFAGNPGVIGRAVKIGGAPVVIVGVAPPGFSGMEAGVPAEIFLTLPAYEQLRPNVRRATGLQWFHTIGRLPDEVPLAATRATVAEQWRILDEEYRQPYGRNTRDTMALEAAGRGFSRVGLEFSGAVLVLMGLVGAVFLIACANLATLLFVRGAGRMREMTIRFALGAARAQLVRQWMTECLLLALVGGLSGAIIARWITDLLLVFVADNDRAWLRFQSEPAVLLLALALTLAAGLICGLLPAIRATAARPDSMLRTQSATVSERREWLTQGILAGQLAASLVLVVAGALFARTLWNLSGSSSGFDRTSVVYAAPNFGPAQLPRDQWTGTVTKVVDELKRSSSISAVSIGPPPMVWGDGGWNYVNGVSGYRTEPDEDNTSWMNTVTPGFFEAMGIPLVAGRDFAEQDRPAIAGRWRVAIVNEKLARHYFGSKSPLGERISFFNTQGAKVTFIQVEIIGVVKDTKNRNLRDPQADVTYLPLPTDLWSAVVARAKPGVSSTTVEAEMRAAFARVSTDIEVDAGPIEEAVQRSLGRDRLVARLSAVFGVLGILLASMGLYAAIAHSVSSRTREIGIRIAVGASARRVSWMVLKQSLGVTAVGLLIGLPLAIAGSRLISSLLFQVSPSDPATLIASATVLAVTGLLAGWWPARRAARLDPSKTLRFE